LYVSQLLGLPFIIKTFPAVLHQDQAGFLKDLYGKAEQVYHGASLTFTVK